MNPDTLTRFTTAFVGSQILQDFAKNRSLLILYRLQDVQQSFYMSFKDGVAKAGMEKPAGQPDLEIEMSAALFDAVMTGKQSATAAAMSGKIRLIGDSMKIMPLQRIQKELERLYQLAK